MFVKPSIVWGLLTEFTQGFEDAGGEVRHMAGGQWQTRTARRKKWSTWSGKLMQWRETQPEMKDQFDLKKLRYHQEPWKSDLQQRMNTWVKIRPT